MRSRSLKGGSGGRAVMPYLQSDPERPVERESLGRQ
jgi:hypothetical protein